MQSLQLRQDPLRRVLRPFNVGDDHQVILGDDAISQPHLVQQQLEPRLQPNPVELELNRIFGLDILPIQRSQVEHHLRLQRLFQMRAHLKERRRPCKRKTIRPQHRILQRPRAGRLAHAKRPLLHLLPPHPLRATAAPRRAPLAAPRPRHLFAPPHRRPAPATQAVPKGPNRRSAPPRSGANDSESCSGPFDSSRKWPEKPAALESARIPNGTPDPPAFYPAAVQTDQRNRKPRALRAVPDRAENGRRRAAVELTRTPQPAQGPPRRHPEIQTRPDPEPAPPPPRPAWPQPEPSRPRQPPKHNPTPGPASTR